MSASIPESDPPRAHETAPPPGPPPVPLTRRWSRALVAGTFVAVLAVLFTHLAATFLYNAPTNPVSARYTKQIHWWMDPLFTQNWRLFAPDPISENVRIEARASLRPDGRATGWVDLSGQDQAEVLDNPVPGHIAENGLRNAWFQWAGTHDGSGNPTGGDADLYQTYLKNLVLDKLHGTLGADAQVGSVQIRAVTTLIPGPGRTARQTAPQTRTLDWWAV